MQVQLEQSYMGADPVTKALEQRLIRLGPPKGLACPIDGGHAEYARSHASYVGAVPQNVDPFEAAPLTCAGVTTYKSVKLSGARSSDLVAVIGVGGLGHMAIQYARIAGCTVVAVDLLEDKQAWQHRIHATLFHHGVPKVD